MISQTTIDDIKLKASLIEVIGETVSLKRAGRSFIGLCPFHSEKTPSFHIRDDDRGYYCFGCGASGNVITYLMETRNISFPEAVEELGSRFGIPVQYEGRDKTKHEDNSDVKKLYAVNRLALSYFAFALSKAPNEVKRYLAGRKLSLEAIKEFQVGFAPDSWDGVISALKGKGVPEAFLLKAGLARRTESGKVYDTFRNRIIFPILVDKRHVVGFGGRIFPGPSTSDSTPKYINSPESPIYKKSKTFYGLPQAQASIRKKGHVFLVEGYMDVIGLWQVGVQNVLASCGTSLTDQHVKRLSSLVSRAYLLFDGDTAGRNAAAKSFHVFLNSGIDASVVFLPEGEDPDTFAEKHGQKTENALKQLGAKSLFECFMDSLIEKHSGESGALGVASKGKLARELMEILYSVTNVVEREALIELAGARLMIAPSQLHSFADSKKNTTGNVPVKTEESDEAVISTVPVKALPKVDQHLLHAIMGSHKLASDLIRDSMLCAGVHPSTLQFAVSLDRILVDFLDEQSQKEQVKALLNQFGASWKEHWKLSYQMIADPQVRLEDLYQDCRKKLIRDQLNSAISSLASKIIISREEGEKISFAQEKLALEKRLQAV